MQALKKYSGVITFAALSLSGSAVWAADSFIAKAKLDSFNLVPPVLSSRTGSLTLTFLKPTPTTLGATIALVLPPNPWRMRTRAPGDQSFGVDNIRLYFGQRFANGQPIATLCDDGIGTLKCNPDPDLPLPEEISGEFDLSSIQFQPQQRGTSGNELIDPDGRLNDVGCGDPDKICGFEVIKDLIKQGLIYVVINSSYKAKVDAGDIFEYEPPVCSFLPLFSCQRGGFIIDDGDLRGTLRL